MATTLASFYSIDQHQQQEEDNAVFQLSLNPNHLIYEGHFPNQPVMPGVCMLQLVTELTSQALGQPLQLKKANQVKFLIPIVPQQVPQIQLKTRFIATLEQTWKVTASIQLEERIFFKFKGLLSL
ncbi:MAG: 3-hydroxyacyl-ACP dehydratase [Aureispira sp.]